MTTTIRGTDNSAAAPALTGNDSDTGIYFPAANKLGLVTGGTERVIVDDSGNVGIGTGSPTAVGSYKVLEVNGTGGGILSLRLGGTEYGQIAGNTGGLTLAAVGATNAFFYTNGTERMRITSAGAVQIANGNLVFSTNGTGIDFSASAGGGASSSLLDDYEEGTWTPSYSQGVTSPTYTLTSGLYKKVGSLVFVSGRIQLSGGTANASHLTMGGLPFSSANAVGTNGTLAIGYNGGFRADGNVTILKSGSGTTAEFYLWDGNNFAGTNANNIQATLHFAGCYNAA